MEFQVRVTILLVKIGLGSRLMVRSFDGNLTAVVGKTMISPSAFLVFLIRNFSRRLGIECPRYLAINLLYKHTYLIISHDPHYT